MSSFLLPDGLVIRYSSMSVTHLSPHPVSQEQVPRPFSNQNQRKEFLILWNCGILNVCFLHIQLLGTNVRLSKIHKILPEVHYESSRSNLSLGIKPIDTAEPCFRHDNIVGIRLCDECMKSILLSVFHKLWSIW